MGTGTFSPGSPFGPPFPVTGGGGDAFAGAQFGFLVPQGDPEAMLQAATAAAELGGMFGGGFEQAAQSVSRAAGDAGADWSGAAHDEFDDYTHALVSALRTNADACTRAGNALTNLATDLQDAQRITKQAATECQHYQTEMTNQQTAASGHQTDADTLNQQATSAPHPAAAADLTRRAGDAQDLANAANRAAGEASDQLSHWETQGQNAAQTYAGQAQHATGEISAAAEQLVALPTAGGGSPSPIQVTRSDINFANKLFPSSTKISNADWRNDPGESFQRLADGPVTPAEVMAMEQVAKEHANEPKGSILDAAGGFVHAFTLGAVSFGNSGTKRYTGGEDAAMIPIDPDSLLIDGDRVAARDGTRIDLSDGWEGDFKKFTDGTAAVQDGRTTTPITLVQYYDADKPGSLKWWTTTEQANSMPTVHDVMDKLALEPEWGERNAVRVAVIPKDTDVTAMTGIAKTQETTPGGGFQIRLRDFDPKWIVTQRRIP
jgi:hypothetical protein